MKKLNPDVLGLCIPNGRGRVLAPYSIVVNNGTWESEEGYQGGFFSRKEDEVPRSRTLWYVNPGEVRKEGESKKVGSRIK